MKLGGSASFLLLTGCTIAKAGGFQRFEFSEGHMGTSVRIVLYASDAEQARAAAREAFAEIRAVDESMSDYKPDSELSRLNRRGSLLCSPPLFEVLQAGQRFAELTDGAFDITVGPAISRWRKGEMPDKTALEKVGWRNLALDPATREARFLKPGMSVDLGGIAKGYAADRAIEALRKAGISRALVQAGGDLVAGDPPPGKVGWEVSLEGAPPQTVSIRNAALSTSGNSQRFRWIEGKRYAHILDPRTGLGLAEVSLVHVKAPRSITADALATALAVLGPDRGPRLLDRLPERDLWFRFQQREEVVDVP